LKLLHFVNLSKIHVLFNFQTFLAIFGWIVEVFSTSKILKILNFFGNLLRNNSSSNIPIRVKFVWDIWINFFLMCYQVLGFCDNFQPCFYNIIFKHSIDFFWFLVLSDTFKIILLCSTQNLFFVNNLKFLTNSKDTTSDYNFQTSDPPQLLLHLYRDWLLEDPHIWITY